VVATTYVVFFLLWPLPPVPPINIPGPRGPRKPLPRQKKPSPLAPSPPRACGRRWRQEAAAPAPPPTPRHGRPPLGCPFSTASLPPLRSPSRRANTRPWLVTATPATTLVTLSTDRWRPPPAPSGPPLSIPSALPLTVPLSLSPPRRPPGVGGHSRSPRCRSPTSAGECRPVGTEFHRAHTPVWINTDQFRLNPRPDRNPFHFVPPRPM